MFELEGIFAWVFQCSYFVGAVAGEKSNRLRENALEHLDEIFPIASRVLNGYEHGPRAATFYPSL